MAIELDPFRPARPAKPEPKRDRWQRYVVPTAAGAFEGHTRVTTIVKQLDDRYNLERWEQRLIVKGLIERDDYFALVTSLDIDHDKKEMHRIFDLAKEYAKGSVGANTGTALHRLTDRIDMGARKIEDYPPRFHPILRCYVDGMDASGLTYDLDYVEQVIIDDDHRVAGTFDRAVMIGRDLYLTFKNGKTVFLPAGTRVIGDLKGLWVDTPIPTPNGWTTMGRLQVGDTVYDRSGAPTTVVAKSPVEYKRCYRIVFDDTTDVIADADHRWWVTRAGRKGEVVMTTEEMAASLRSPTTGQRWLQIHNTAPLQGRDDIELPVDPYLLGAWLGDGHVREGLISKPLPALWAEIERRGHQVSEPFPWGLASGTRRVVGLTKALRPLGLQGHKRIPTRYLQAPEPQRRDLLAGLMDSDGSFNSARRECVFYTTDKDLATQVEELILSLGYRSTFQEVKRQGFGKTVTSYDIKFRPHDQTPFIAKADHWDDVVKPVSRSRRRLVQSVTAIPSVPTQCIAVNSVDQSYLCGRQMLPTHNTGANLNFSWMSMAAQFAAYANHTATWDQVTQRRGPRIDFNTQAGLVIHLPATAEHPHLGLYWLDLEAGYEAYKLGCQLHKIKATGEKLATTHPVEDTQIVDAVAAWIRQRGEAILAHPAARADLALHWPMILRNPNGTRKRLPDRPTPDEVAALIPVLDAIEAEHELPFGPPMPGAEIIPISRARKGGRRGT